MLDATSENPQNLEETKTPEIIEKKVEKPIEESEETETENEVEAIAEAEEVSIIEKVELSSKEEIGLDAEEKVEVASKEELEIEAEEKATAKVVEAIEEKVAAEAEKEEEKEVVPVMDFKTMTMEQLVKELESLVKNQKIQAIKSNVESIKKVFDTKFGEILAEKKAAFLEAGGESIDFHYGSPLKVSFNELLLEYKSKRNKHYSDLEGKLKENLNKRIEVIDNLKAIIEKADSSTMYKEFKGLQDAWKSIGPVPRTKYNNTWRNYHHHVERFYDLLHLNNDLRELDFRHNLEEKTKIVERAVVLSEMDDVSKAFKELQELHKLWKEDIGPVSREFREDIWQKFSAATKIIHDKRDSFFEGQKSKYEENIQLKLNVISGLEEYDTSKNKTHSDWQKSIKEFEAKREVFFTIGKVPRNKSQQIWEKLKVATKKFNHDKNIFYKELNSSQQENLEKKLALVALAKSLENSEDFGSATSQMKRIQADWKKIGHVPRKFSDKIWKEFKDACNHYFDRIHEIQDNGSSDEIDAFETKTDFLSQIKGVVGNTEITLEEVKAYVETWKNIGRVPRKEKSIENDFNKVIEVLFEQLSITGDELLMLKYRMAMDALVASNNSRKIDSEVQYVRKKIEELTKGIQQLDNNISFIANATEDNPLVKNVRNSIAKQEKEVIIWKQKLNYLRSLN